MTDGPPICPHCKLWHDGRVVKMCPDRDRWTRAEKDAWREQARRDHPAIQFPLTFSRDALNSGPSGAPS